MACVLQASGEEFPHGSRLSAVLSEVPLRSSHADGLRSAAARLFDDEWVDRSPGGLGEPSLKAQIDEYLHETSQARVRDQEADAREFLAWLFEDESDAAPAGGAVDPDDACPSVELLQIRQRLAHSRFQRRLAASQPGLAELTAASREPVVLNPIHVWATLAADPQRSDADAAPVEVLFFPVQEEIRTARLGEDASRLLHDIERGSARRVRDLARSGAIEDREEIVPLLRSLCELGIIAIG